MQRPLVGVVVGTRSDFNVMRRGLETLRIMGVPYTFEIISPHRDPHRLADFAHSAGERGIEVLMTAEGGTSLIASHMAGYTTLPIIGVPVDATALRGQDALYSMAMLPAGIPVAVVGINNSENAAILAAQILALKHPQFRAVLAHRRMSGRQRTESIARELGQEYPDLTLPERTAPLKAPKAAEDDTDSTPDSEAATPEPPPEESAPIRPGAVWAEPPRTGTEARSLVSTPVPQEPGVSFPTEEPRTLKSIMTGPMARAKGSPADYETLDDALPLGETPDPDPVSPRRPTPIPMKPPADEDLADTPPPPVLRRAVQETTPRPTPKGKQAKGIDTKVFTVDRAEPDDDLVDHAMMVLLEGGIIAVPTDTVYGLAADATNPDAIARLTHLKDREHQKTLGVLIHHPDMLDNLVSEVPPELEKVMEECWPGALTIILPKNPESFSDVSKTDRIGVRIPSDQLCLSIIEKVGRPIVMRNAGSHGEAPMTEPGPVVEEYKGHIDCILDGGDCPNSTGASTVLSAVGGRFEILREGAVSRDKLKELLGSKLKD